MQRSWGFACGLIKTRVRFPFSAAASGLSSTTREDSPLPKLLDTFCCAGGAGTGYSRAGFDIIGVDLNPQPNYPFEFIQGDAIEFIREHGHEFDVIHASPPCQAYSSITPDAARSRHAQLIEPTREALEGTGRLWVIENVAGAKKHLVKPARLCGSSFGLRVRRHRYFETNWGMTGSVCDHKAQGEAVGVYGSHPDRKRHLRPDGSSRGVKATSAEDASDALGGVDWMVWREMAECIPPAYTEFIGGQLMQQLEG